MKKIILIGGGGHCKSCIDVIEQTGIYEIFGVLDVAEKVGEKIFNYEIIGVDSEIQKYSDLGFEFLITVGQIKSAKTRMKIFHNLRQINAKMATIVSPLAYVSKYASLEEGTIVMHHAFVNAGAKVGMNVILNTACHLEHDSSVGDHCHISTGVFVNGDSKIGNETFIGSKTTVSSQVNVGNNVIIGAGSLVIKNIENNRTVIGVPTKEIER